MNNYRLNEPSRTLYVGNLNENINDATLFKYFGEFGKIISINIKNGEYVGGKRSKIYAFIKYFDSNNVIMAIKKKNGINIEGCRVRLNFGKTYRSSCVWITGFNELGDNNNFLLTCAAEFGTIVNFLIDYINKRALIYFKEFVDSEAAINKMMNGPLNGVYLRADYASAECQQKFSEFFEKPNQHDKKYLSINLDNVDVQNTSISNDNKQKSAVSHYVEAGIASKKIISETTCIWVEGIADSVTNEYLESHFSQFGPIHKCLIDQFNKRAWLCFQEELHAQLAITEMNGKYIKDKLVYVHLASSRSQASDVPNINIDNDTIQLKDNTAQSSSYSARHVDPSCKSTINDEHPMNIRDPRNKSNYVNNAQYTSQHKYLNTQTIDIPKYSSKTNHINNSPSTITVNKYPTERHAQLAISVMNGKYIKDKLVYDHLASSRSQASYVANINIDNDTIQLKDNTAQSSSYSARHVDPSCKSTINDEHPMNIRDPRNKSNYVNNAQCTSQHKYLNTQTIDIPKYSSKTNHINNSPSTITVNKYPTERLQPPTQYADSDILSPPLPEFAKNNSKELTSTSSKYSLSSNAFGNQDKYTFNEHHDEMINYGLGKTDNQDKKQEQNNNHPPKSNYKIKESAAKRQHFNFKDVINKHGSKEFIQSQSSPKFKDQQLSSSLGTLSTSGSSKYSLGPSASVIQAQNNSIEHVVRPNFVDVEKSTNIDVEKSTNIDEEKIDKSIAKILLSLKTNYQKRILHNETKEKILDSKSIEPTDISDQNSSCSKSDINNDNKSKKYTKKVDGNITSSYCSTENSLKRSVSNPSECHNDSKRLKTDNKTSKNDSIKTSKHHSPLSKPSKNIHNNWKPENKNQPRTRGWINGHSITDILSSDSKVSRSNKVKTTSTNNNKEEWKFESDNSD